MGRENQIVTDEELTKMILKDHSLRIEKLEEEMKDLRGLLAIK